MAKTTLKNVHRLINMATNELPANEQFVADLKVAIEKIDAKDKRIPSQSYKPSSMTCVRNMYFQVTGTEPDPSSASSELVGICESGSDRHERIQNAVMHMKDIGIDCEYVDVAVYVEKNKLTHLKIVKRPNPSEGIYETKLYNEKLNMSFLCDGIIKYRGKYYILEVKTESIYKFQDRTNVAEEHIPQGTCYSTNLLIDDVMFLYENRDNCSKKAYLLHVTDDMKMDIVGKIEECDSYVKKLTPPPKPLDVPKKTCSYCNYKSSCRKAGK